MNLILTVLLALSLCELVISRHLKNKHMTEREKEDTEQFLEHLLYKNVIIPENWRTDPRFDLQWKGGFTYGLPRGSKCPRVIIPSFGRVVCSDGRGLSRTMCLSECMIGYQHVEKSKVFICHKDGTWMNIFKQRIQTPFIQCAPMHNYK